MNDDGGFSNFLSAIVEAHNADVVRVENERELRHLQKWMLDDKKWDGVYTERYHGDPFRMYTYKFEGYKIFAYVFCEAPVAFIISGKANNIAIVRVE